MTAPDAIWPAVDRYLGGLFTPSDDTLIAALADSDAAGLPAIGVTPLQGKLLGLLVRATGARNVLEIGTLGGYSAIWMARALPPQGRLVTLEYEPRHAEVAQANFIRAGVADRVEVRLGSALETLPQLIDEGAGPFDLVFIDADKRLYADFLALSLRLSRPGTLIIADNVVRKGAIADPENRDENVRGAIRFLEALSAEPAVSSTVIQTVGGKGYDGWAIAVVGGEGA